MRSRPEVMKEVCSIFWIYSADVKSRPHFQDEKYWQDNGYK